MGKMLRLAFCPSARTVATRRHERRETLVRIPMRDQPALAIDVKVARLDCRTRRIPVTEIYSAVPSAPSAMGGIHSPKGIPRMGSAIFNIFRKQSHSPFKI
jgi:hypothetical protein